MKRISFFVIGFVIFFLLLSGCRSFRVEHDLTPAHEQFLSEVRYIITRQEKKIFLSLPTPEREQFIEEFWLKRDPNPDTETNEFEEQYYQRIEEANKLFREGGTPGWLQDRGRIYILLGPPEARDKFPMGYNFYDRPSEVWYYGFYPIIFIDYSYAGNYRLYPMSAQYLAILLKAQLDRKPGVEKEDQVFNFKLKLEQLSGGRVVFILEIPYKDMWLVEEAGKLQTVLQATVDVFSDSKKVWDHSEQYAISLTPESLKEAIGKKYTISIEAKLSPGKYKATIMLENKTEEKRVQKSIKFDLK